MRETFFLRLKPFSMNTMYYGDQRIKTVEAREWTAKVLHQLNWARIQKPLERLRNHFNPEKHTFRVRLTAYYPAVQFFTKKGSVSQKTMDLSNWEKPLIDIIFLPKYYDAVDHSACKNLNADDKYITSLSSQKVPYEGEEHLIRVSIKICDKPSIEPVPDHR